MRRTTLTTISAPTALADLMTERGIPATAQTLVLEAIRTVEERGVPVQARPSRGHISLLASGQAVAAFVHPRRLSLTFDKDVATDLAREYDICELQAESNNRTGHVRIGYDRLRDPRWTSIVGGLLVEALERSRVSEPGQVRAQRVAAPPVTPAVPQCAIHQQAMFGGSCYLCD